MDKIAKETINEKLKLPFIAALVGILILIVGMLLPYMTAVGKMAEYIEKNPDNIEIKDLNLTASDLQDISIVSVNRLIIGAYGEDDGVVANVIVIVFSGFLALTALFAILKKPIAVIICDMLTFGTFAFLNFLMSEDFIDPDKYAWSIGYYAIVFAVVAVFASAIWMLIAKIAVNKEHRLSTRVEVE